MLLMSLNNIQEILAIDWTSLYHNINAGGTIDFKSYNLKST